MKIPLKKISLAFGIIFLSTVGFYFAFVIFLGMVFFGYFQPEPAVYSFNGIPCNRNRNEASRFQSFSSLSFPEDALVISSCSEQSTFQGESEYYIVFDTSADSIAELRQMAIEDSDRDWKSGPIPDAIRKTTVLNKVFDEEFQANDIDYLNWKNGDSRHLLVIHPSRNRVLYSWSNYSSTG